MRAARAAILALLLAACASGARAEPDPSQAPATAPKGRGLEDVQNGFDSRKDKYFELYKRLGGNEPGRVVISITIQPDGSVSDCHLVSSTFSDDALAQAVIEESKTIRFPARPGPALVYPNYPFSFLPD